MENTTYIAGVTGKTVATAQHGYREDNLDPVILITFTDGTTLTVEALQGPLYFAVEVAT